ncbi:MAG: GNAT family N-acetyltransferase, partial [Actinomycetia bacterium]|nr:GNAT family N-acetyltransferase [Actinomycetes bacterium]
EGGAAAMPMILLHRDRPQIAYQGDTGVLAAHRGKRIGRWIKAANYQLVRQSHPELSAIETYNAQSNAWMLDINVAMGFRPHHHYTAYQGSIDEVAAALG